MQLLLLARHGQSLFNVDQVVNGDPALDRGLSPLGARQAQELRLQLSTVRIDLCVTSEFPRARETARLALGKRADGTATVVDPDLNDIRIGELEGQSLDAYRAWKNAHPASTTFPGERASATRPAAMQTRSSGCSPAPRRLSSASVTRSRCATPSMQHSARRSSTRLCTMSRTPPRMSSTPPVWGGRSRVSASSLLPRWLSGRRARQGAPGATCRSLQ